MGKFLSQIPNSWLQTQGKGTRVGVCDTGIFIEHSSIAHAVKDNRLFGVQNQTVHGTHVLGIICGKPKTANQYRGLATQADLFVASIPLGNSADYMFVKKALLWLKDKNIDVLNLSFAYDDDDVEIRELLREMSVETLVIASHSSSLRYPHSYPFVVSVGYDKELMDKMDVVTVGTFVSCGENDTYKEMTGSSMATAFVTSVASLAKAYDKTMNKERFLSFVVGKELLVPGRNVTVNLLGRKQVNLVSSTSSVR